MHATDNGNPGNFGTRFVTLKVSPIQGLNTPSVNGFVGTPYNATFTATGATSWALGAGSQLPPGVTFNSNGTFTGTPTSAGTFNANYIVTLTGGATFHGYFTINIYPAAAIPPPTFNFGNDFGTWNIGEIQWALSASNGNGTYSWSLVNGALPTGLVIRTDVPSGWQANQQAGLIGVATTPGTYNFTLAVTSGGQTSYQYCTWKIAAGTLKDGPVPQAFVGVPYNYTLTPLNMANASFTNIQNLPPGISLSGSGVLSGTPSTPGNYNVNFTVSNSTESFGRGFQLSVAAVHFTNAAILPNTPQNGTVNFQFTADGGSGGYTFTSNNLPNGLTLSSGVGVCSPAISTSALASSTSTPPSRIPVTTRTTRQFSIVAVGSPILLPRIDLNEMVHSPIFNDRHEHQSFAQCRWRRSRPLYLERHWPTQRIEHTRQTDVSARDFGPGDIEIWGTPTQAGDFNVTYTVTDADGLIASITRVLTVSPMVVDGGDYLPNGTRSNTAYSKKLPRHRRHKSLHRKSNRAR